MGCCYCLQANKPLANPPPSDGEGMHTSSSPVHHDNNSITLHNLDPIAMEGPSTLSMTSPRSANSFGDGNIPSSGGLHNSEGNAPMSPTATSSAIPLRIRPSLRAASSSSSLNTPIPGATKSQTLKRKSSKKRTFDDSTMVNQTIDIKSPHELTSIWSDLLKEDVARDVDSVSPMLSALPSTMSPAISASTPPTRRVSTLMKQMFKGKHSSNTAADDGTMPSMTLTGRPSGLRGFFSSSAAADEAVGDLPTTPSSSRRLSRFVLGASSLKSSTMGGGSQTSTYHQESQNSGSVVDGDGGGEAQPLASPRRITGNESPTPSSRIGRQDSGHIPTPHESGRSLGDDMGGGSRPHSGGGGGGGADTNSIDAASTTNRPTHRRQSSGGGSSFSRFARGSSLSLFTMSPVFTSTTSTPPPISPVPPNPSHPDRTQVSLSTLSAWLKRTNGDNTSPESIEATLRSVTMNNRPTGQGWTMDEFELYLFSADNQVEDMQLMNLPHDLTRPLTEYFVSTSHNTYLDGGQYTFTGALVDANMYARAFAKGCRCVEIDLWDGPDGDPVVKHGNAAAMGGGSVTFLEVITVIAREAFVDVTSPIILNLENNLGKQSKRAAEMLLEAFGDRIVRIDDDQFGWCAMMNHNGVPSDADLVELAALPSVEALKGRVLCRAKCGKTHVDFQRLVYFRNTKFFETPDAAEFDRRELHLSSSLSENKVERALAKYPVRSPLEINLKFLNRIYPRPTAVASQNYNPVPFWLFGFQLVALNFQTSGVEMDVNRCMFRRGGGSGYVLKPPLMRRGVTPFQQGGVVVGGGNNGVSPSRIAQRLVTQSPGTEANSLLGGGIGGAGGGGSGSEPPIYDGPRFKSSSHGGAGGGARSTTTEGRKSTTNAEDDDDDESDGDIPGTRRHGQSMDGTSSLPYSTPLVLSRPLTGGGGGDGGAKMGSAGVEPSTIGDTSVAVVIDIEEGRQRRRRRSTGSVHSFDGGGGDSTPIIHAKSSIDVSSLSITRELRASSKSFDESQHDMLRLGSSDAGASSDGGGGGGQVREEQDVSRISKRSEGGGGGGEAMPSKQDPPPQPSPKNAIVTDVTPNTAVDAPPSGAGTGDDNDFMSLGDMLAQAPTKTRRMSEDLVTLADVLAQAPATRTRRMSNDLVTLADVLAQSPPKIAASPHSTVTTATAPPPRIVRTPPSTTFGGGVPRSAVCINSIEITVISLKCNIAGKRKGSVVGHHLSSVGSRKLGASSGAGGGWFSQSQSKLSLPPLPILTPSSSSTLLTNRTTTSNSFDQNNDEDEEDVRVEILVDGHPLDSANKWLSSSIALMGHRTCVLPPSQEGSFVAILCDSEAAMFSFRILDGSDEIRASRSLFAHCIKQGERTLTLFNDDATLSYLLTCQFKPVYSMFSPLTEKFVLFDNLSANPLISVPSRISLIEATILKARCELLDCSLKNWDPFIGIEIIGVPSDTRTLRTPRTSLVRKQTTQLETVAEKSSIMGKKTSFGSRTSAFFLGAMLTAPPPPQAAALPPLQTTTTTGTGDATPSQDSSNAGISKSARLLGLGDNSFDTVSWNSSLNIPLTWSEFAFARVSLVTNASGGRLETKKSQTTGPTPKSRRRLSIAEKVIGASSTNNSVFQGGGTILGKHTIWLDAVRQGYRSIKLYDPEDESRHVATLLCHFTTRNALEETFEAAPAMTMTGSGDKLSTLPVNGGGLDGGISPSGTVGGETNKNNGVFNVISTTSGAIDI